MSDYAATVRKHRRLAILRHLEALPEYTSNAAILQDVLLGLGLPSTRDQVTTDLNWLFEQGFVTLSGQGFVVVTATARGVDLALGRATHPDVQRPSARP